MDAVSVSRMCVHRFWPTMGYSRHGGAVAVARGVDLGLTSIPHTILVVQVRDPSYLVRTMSNLQFRLEVYMINRVVHLVTDLGCDVRVRPIPRVIACSETMARSSVLWSMPARNRESQRLLLTSILPIKSPTVHTHRRVPFPWPPSPSFCH